MRFFRPYVDKHDSVHPFLCSINMMYMSPNAPSAFSLGDGKCQPRKADQSVYAGPKSGLLVLFCLEVKRLQPNPERLFHFQVFSDQNAICGYQI